MTTSTSLAAALTRLITPGALITDPAELPAYGQDFLGERGTPGIVVRAKHADDVAALLHFAQKNGVAVVPRTAGTNVSYGFMPRPERILLDLRDLNQITSIDPERREAVVQSGVINGDLNARLAPLGLCYSPDPASAPISSIGGNIAENAGGPRCLKYGNTVHHVHAVTCVLAGGDTLRLDAADEGPDLLGAFIGSEGTFGIATEARLRLRPLAPLTRTLLAVFDRSEDAVEAVSTTIAGGLVPAAMEFFDRSCAQIIEEYSPSGYPTDAEAILLVDIDGEPDEVAYELPRVEAILRRGAREVRRADDEETRAALWRGRLLAAHALTSGGRHMYFGDVTVPRQHLPELARRAIEIARRRGVRLINVGHIGDGNVHPSFAYDPFDPAQAEAVHLADDEVVKAALSLGGTLTGEHGVGNAKRHHMPQRFTPAEIAAMRAVKRAFDPAGILNPDVLLPEAATSEPALPIFAERMEHLMQERRAGHAWQPPSEQMAPVVGSDVRPDPANLTVTAEAGIELSALHNALAAASLRCALPAARTSVRTIADALSDDAARAGVRECLLAVRAILPDGQAVRFGSDAVKDVAGYDLKRLYTGSGSWLGQVQEVTLRVEPTRTR